MLELQQAASACTSFIINLYKDDIKSAISKAGSIISDEIHSSFETGLTEYLSKSASRYSVMKTLLSSGQPVDIEKYFVAQNMTPCNTACKINSEKKTISYTSFFEKTLREKRIAIYGNGGVGKSTLLKKIFIDILHSKKAIPVFIELRKLNDSEISILDHIKQQINDYNHTFSAYFDIILSKGKIAFMLDGFDEIKSSLRKQYHDEITKLSYVYNNSIFIITSRQSEDYILWEHFSDYKINGFTLKQASKMIDRVDFDSEVKNKFISDLEKYIYEKHKSFASNPLLLSMLFLTYGEYAEIPESLSIFYERTFDTIVNKHDASKGGFKRQTHSNIDYENLKTFLCYFCINTYLNDTYTFSSEQIKNYINTALRQANLTYDTTKITLDLSESYCLILKDGFDYTFAHRSFQEYFAALFVHKFANIGKFEFITALAEKEATGNIALSLLHNIDKNLVDDTFIYPAITQAISIYGNSKISKIEFLKLFFNIIDTIENKPFIYYAGKPNQYLSSILLLLKSAHKYKAEHLEPIFKFKEIKDQKTASLFKNTTLSAMKRIELKDLKAAGVIEGAERLYAFIKKCKESIEKDKTNCKASCTELLSTLKNHTT